MKQTTKYLSTRQAKGRILSILVAIAAIVGVTLLFSANNDKGYAAAVGSLYVTPASGTDTVGNTVAIDIRENSGTTPVIAVQGKPYLTARIS